MARRLRAAGSENFVVFEKASSVGGTWRENTYPGLACDVPAHYYCYRDKLGPGWTRMFAPGEEIKSSFEDVATSEDLLRSVRFDTEVVSACFENGQWQVTTSDGRCEPFDAVVCTTGVLHRPRVPDIDGLSTFSGPVFHAHGGTTAWMSPVRRTDPSRLAADVFQSTGAADRLRSARVHAAHADHRARGLHPR